MPDNVKNVSTPPIQSLGFKGQDKLPKLPIPPLEDTLQRYLRALEGLQDERERAQTAKAVEEFLKGEGPRIHSKLISWAGNKSRYAVLFPV
jgi:carnitine O-acetyltransferase